MKVLNTVDLFCGAGGASTGMEDALHDLKLTHKGLAINHWAVAVEAAFPVQGPVNCAGREEDFSN